MIGSNVKASRPRWSVWTSTHDHSRPDQAFRRRSAFVPGTNQAPRSSRHHARGNACRKRSTVMRSYGNAAVAPGAPSPAACCVALNSTVSTVNRRHGHAPGLQARLVAEVRSREVITWVMMLDCHDEVSNAVARPSCRFLNSLPTDCSKIRQHMTGQFGFI